MSLDLIAKLGAILSSVGVALLVAFVFVILVFPVNKECNTGQKCSYSSTAPHQIAAIVQPWFLATSLLVIAAGVFMVRFSRWKSDKKTKSGA